MRTLYLDCGMGAAGDMLTAALLELLPDQQVFIDEFNALGLPGVRMKREDSVKCGIRGTRVIITVGGEEEESLDVHRHENPPEHGHEHHHEHNHTSMADIEHIVKDHLNLPEDVKDDILAVYTLIAEAESHVHGVPVTDIHFHEVGTMDAVADIAAVCMLTDRIAPEQIISSPVRTGTGQVRCAHGILPVPAPATAYILQGVPIYDGNIEGELCTPTGAALLKHFVTEFKEMPVMRIQAAGYGMGKKDFEAANCVRAMLGETESEPEDTVIELSCNVDDMTAEQIAFAAERLFADGAREVYTVPVGMKKSRPGTLICVICSAEDKDKLVRSIFKHTTTLGIREMPAKRYILDRRTETVETPLGSVRLKKSSGYGVTREKYEYDDLAGIARERNMSMTEVINTI